MEKYKISKDNVHCDQCGVLLHEDTNWINECQEYEGDEIWCDDCGAKIEADTEHRYEMWLEEHGDEEEE